MRAPVSVIIPCYRCAETIERAVSSIVQQTLPPEEIVLVEDCSSDEGETLGSLYRVQQEYNDKVILKIIPMEKNSGPAVARNRGWEAATQPYIAFLDADDEWHPEKLDIQYRYMQENPEITATGHQYVWLRNNKPPLHITSMPEYKIISPLSLLFKNCFPTSSVMLKSKTPFRFSAGQRYAEDYYLWQQLAFAGFRIARIEVPLVNYYKGLYGEGGLSAQLWNMEKGELGNFSALYRAGSINWPLLAAATTVSFAKYIKRVIVTWVNQATLRWH